ncbi:MAG: MFS transporter, partial [Pseudomonadota bacterium]|nr:MFS transporter [Pseudomonadota bacterium]
CAMLVAFVMVEARRGARAMMPLAMFADRAFVGLNLLTFLLYGAFGATMLLLPYLLITASHYSPI